MSKELSKTYDPKDIEDRLYKKWEDNGYFHAEVDRSKKPFTIVMPPPNITGQLHMGHALDNTMLPFSQNRQNSSQYPYLQNPAVEKYLIMKQNGSGMKAGMKAILKQCITCLLQMWMNPWYSECTQNSLKLERNVLFLLNT